MQLKPDTSPASILSYAAIAVFGLLPFFFLPFSSVLVLQSKILLISIALIAGTISYAYIRFKSSDVEFPRSWLALPVLALPCVYALSAIISGAHSASFVSGIADNDTVATVALFAGVFFLGAFAIRGFEQASTIFFRAFLLGASVMMLIQAVHVLAPSFTFGVLASSASSVFGSWHDSGIIAGLCAFLSLALWNTNVLYSRWKWILPIVAVLSAITLIIVNLSDVWYTSAALFAAYAVYLYIRGIRISAVSFWIAIIAAGSCIGGGFFGEGLYSSLPERLQVLQVEVRPSLSGTFAIGRESIDGVRTALLGSGPNTFSRQWGFYKPAEINETQYWNVDFKSGIAFIPTVFVTVGIVGMIAWASILGLLVYECARRIRHLTNNDRPLLVLMFACLYLALFHVVYSPSITLTAIMFAAFGVLASASGYRIWSAHVQTGSRTEKVRMAALFILIAVILLASIGSIRAVISDVLVNRSAVVFAKERSSQKALSLIRKALVVNSSNDRAHRAAIELGLVQLQELVGSGRVSDQAVASLQMTLQNTIQHGLAAVQSGNGDYQNWLALANMYQSLAGAGVPGAYDEAKEAYSQAAAENPNNPLPLAQLAQLEIAEGNIEDAIALLDKAVALKPDLAAALYLRAQARSAKDDFEGAISDATKASELSPEDALVWYGLGSILYGAGQNMEAVRSLERAIALRSDYANALYVLGLAYDKLGRRQDALGSFDEVLRLNPGNEGALREAARIRGSAE